MIVPDRVVWISVDFQAQQSLELAENDAKNENIQWAAVLWCQWERSVEKGQTGQSWQEGDSNHILQQSYAEVHPWTHNMSNLLSG